MLELIVKDVHKLDWKRSNVMACQEGKKFSK